MTIPTLETIASYITIIIAIFGAITAAFWLSTVIWAFRDMRLRSRDPFAQILAALLVGAIPFVGILIYLILRPPETLAERYERALEEEALLQEIEERPRCHKCSRFIEDKWAMCPSCQIELQKQCPSCFNLLELSWSRCPHCTAVQPAKRPALTPELLRKSLLQPNVITMSDIQQAEDAQQALPPKKTSVHTPRRSIRRRYRTTQIGGDDPTIRPQPIPGKFIVGDDHPTVVQMPGVLTESRPKLTENGENTYVSEPSA